MKGLWNYQKLKQLNHAWSSDYFLLIYYYLSSRWVVNSTCQLPILIIIKELSSLAVIRWEGACVATHVTIPWNDSSSFKISVSFYHISTILMGSSILMHVILQSWSYILHHDVEECPTPFSQACHRFCKSRPIRHWSKTCFPQSHT